MVKEIGDLGQEKTLPNYYIKIYEEAIERLEDQIEKYKERIKLLEEAEERQLVDK